MSKLFCMPYTTSINILDPAPPLAGSSEAPRNLPPGVNACAEQCPRSSTARREVLQEVKMCFKVFVRQNRGLCDSWQYVLGFSSQDFSAFHIAYLSVTQSRGAAYTGDPKLWEVEFDPTSCFRIAAADEGQRFCLPVLAGLEVCKAREANGDASAFDPGVLKLVDDSSGQSEEIRKRWAYEIKDEMCNYVVLRFNVCVSRRVPKRDWTRLRCKKAPETKSTLLAMAERTGDVVLVGQDGVEAAAHSAVLVDVPYFEAKLREEWSGTTAWNLHNKLRLRLPCPAGAETLKLFLQSLYGDLRSLYEVKPESLLLQEVLSLADACGVPSLCADVIQLVEVTSANVDSWLEWPLVDHGADAEPIREQVVEVMRAQLRDALQQDPLSVEQLATISRVLPRRTVPHVAS